MWFIIIIIYKFKFKKLQFRLNQYNNRFLKLFCQPNWQSDLTNLGFKKNKLYINRIRTYGN